MEKVNKSEKARQRRRVPLSCLICKKRKVKCDKARPSCGGCSKNGVAHLCEYLEPYWTDGVNGSVNDIQSKEQLSPTQTEEYKQLKTANEKIMATQRREIEDLKRKLSVLKQLPSKFSPSDGDIGSVGSYGSSSFGSSGSRNSSSIGSNGSRNSSNKSANNSSREPITVLQKLCPPNLQSREGLIVQRDQSFNIVVPSKLRPTNIETYNWVNLIRLDPHLTIVWSKITKLQKIYHTYKMRQVKSSDVILEAKSEMSCPVTSYDVDLNAEDQSQIQSSQIGNQIGSLAYSGFFDYSANAPSSFASNSSSFSESNYAPSPKFEDLGRQVVIKIQKLWDAVLHHGGPKLSYYKICFVLQHYFSSQSESVRILSFYKKEVESLVTGDEDKVTLRLSGNMTNSSDENKFRRFTAKGVYLCLLGLIVEEVIDAETGSTQKSTSSNTPAKTGKCPVNHSNTAIVNPHGKHALGNSAELMAILKPENDAPTDVKCPMRTPGTNDSKTAVTGLLPLIQETLLFIHQKTLQMKLANISMAYVACTIALLNKQVVSAQTSNFVPMYENLLEVVVGGSLEIWKNPESINFPKEQESTLNASDLDEGVFIEPDLPLHVTILWHDLIRLTNLGTFNLIPHSHHPLIPELNLKIAIANQSLQHLKYLSGLTTPHQTLSLSLHVHYFISKIFGVLHHGIWKFGEPKVYIFNMLELIEECSTWLVEPGLRNLSSVRRFEIVAILSYLRLFILYAIALQAEESSDEDMLTLASPIFYVRLYDFLVLIKGTLESGSDKYITSVVTELLSRTIQIVIGVIIRAKTPRSMLWEDINKNEKLINEKVNAELGISLEEYLRVGLINLVDTTVALLNNPEQTKSASFEVDPYIESESPHDKLEKIWKFYLTFINNSGKMNGMIYAKIHEKVPNFNVCPIKDDKPIEGEALVAPSATHFKKCPISHITTPMYDFEKPPSPLIQEKRSDSKKRKCPFDHTSLKNLQIGKGIESNIRSKRKFSPLSQDAHDTATPITPNRLAPPTPLAELAAASASVSSVSSPIVGPGETEVPPPANDLPEFLNDDLNGLLDFDLDFLSNSTLFDQIGSLDGSF